jgi:hypothetical protein
MGRWQRFLSSAMIVGAAAAGCGDDDTGTTTTTATTQGNGGSGAVGGMGGMAGGGGSMGQAPAAPTLVSVEPLGAGLHVTWMDNSDNEDNFVLERHDGSGTFMEVTTLPFDSTSYHDEGTLMSGTMYTYRVGAINAAGTTYSNEVTGTAP